MKNFSRSVSGKTLNYFTCIISVCVVIACVAGFFAMVDGTGRNFYVHSEQNLIEYFEESFYVPSGYTIVWNALTGKIPENSGDQSFFFRLEDTSGNLICESADAEDVGEWLHSYEYAVNKKSNGQINDIIAVANSSLIDGSWDGYKLYIEAKEGSSGKNELDLTLKAVHFLYAQRYSIFMIAIIAVIFAFASFISLMSAVGHRPGTDELYPGLFDKVPFDLLITAAYFAIAGGIYILDDYNGYVFAGLALIFGVAVLGMTLILCMCAASAIKQHVIIKNTIVFRSFKLFFSIMAVLWCWIKKLLSFTLHIVRIIPLVWKTALMLIAFLVYELIMMASAYGSPGIAVLMYLIQAAVLFAGGIVFAVSLKKLQKGSTALAEGDLSHITDTKGMFWDLKKHGENLNSIACGMAIAVEDRIKSERMKTELITNVSHDIKTPLTSIINYASLIGEEPCENSKIREYAAVLVRQSERLKRLIEDLVEASKASTGNLEVNLAPCDAETFVTQAAGEYEEKLIRSNLTLITRQPESDIHIMADGRRMWRIFDNLMNNICKYSLPGTRVYLSLEQIGGNAVFTFKNTSKDELNISEDELMERFTRGDSSRNTEGNGLGLSIAKSMAELQNGNLKVSIDGDLFKATLSFPVIQ